MNGYEIISRKEVFSGSELGRNVIVYHVKNSGTKPNLAFVDEAESQCSCPEDKEIFSTLKNVMTRCWNTNPDERLQITDGK